MRFNGKNNFPPPSEQNYFYYTVYNLQPLSTAFLLYYQTILFVEHTLLGRWSAII